MKWLTLCFVWLMASCVENYVSPGSQNMGYAPVYKSREAITTITIGTARKTSVAGKIYAYKNFIFQNDLNTGIHIIDNTDPTAPKKIGYINIPLSSEVAVKGDFLYSNNYEDLVVFDISKPSEPRFLNRVAAVFPPANQTYPPFNNTSFECADPGKGVVVAWERKTLTGTRCRR